jgi:hypothetical protein
VASTDPRTTFDADPAFSGRSSRFSGWHLLALCSFLLSLVGMLWWYLDSEASERIAGWVVAAGLLTSLGAWTAGEFAALRRRIHRD